MIALFAQASPADIPAAPVAAWIVLAITGLTPVLVSFIGWLFDAFGSKLQPWLKPLLATGLGALGAFLAGITVTDPVKAALLGLATIGVREIVSQLGQRFAPQRVALYFARK